MKFDLKEAFQKRSVRIAAIVAGCILVILIALPLLIDVNSFRPKIESEITSALGRPVTLGKLSLSILSGAIRVDDVSIADDARFSKEPFVTAKSLEVGVEVMPLIFSKELKITGLVLEQPQVALIKSADGTWNFSSLGAAGGKAAPAAEKSGEGGRKPVDFEARGERREGHAGKSECDGQAAGFRQAECHGEGVFVHVAVPI